MRAEAARLTPPLETVSPFEKDVILDERRKPKSDPESRKMIISWTYGSRLAPVSLGLPGMTNCETVSLEDIPRDDPPPARFLEHAVLTILNANRLA